MALRTSRLLSLDRSPARGTSSETVTQRFSELRRNPDELRGALSNSPQNGFLRLIAAGRRVAIDDGELTGNSHRWRWLVVDGDHIGRRESWAALERLAARCVGLDDEALARLKSAEMDREDEMDARKETL